MKTKEIRNHEIYEAPNAEIYDLEVELVYLQEGGYGSGDGPDIPGHDL